MTSAPHSRREFLEFFGRSAAALSVLPLLNACATAAKVAGEPGRPAAPLPFEPLPPSGVDDVVLAGGFSYSLLISWGEKINTKGEAFGFNNDYIAFVPTDTAGTEGMLWVNHEYPDPLFISGRLKQEAPTRAQVIKEQKSLGGSLLRVEKDAKTGVWRVVKNHPSNRRIDGTTPIPLVSERPIRGATTAIGTFANCAGGVTPWRTVLTCEENYDSYYGEVSFDEKHEARRTEPSSYQWDKHFDRPPEHYGWVVEVNPLTGAAKKLTALGRFAHESATVVQAKDGRCVAYSGDDAADQCLYKFISDKPGSLESGTLYVANLEAGKWVSLKRSEQRILQEMFLDQTETLIRTREAADLLGGSKLDRPEDIEVDPRTGAVYVALTNNAKRGNYTGSILKIVEKGNDPLSLEFQSSTFLAGGESTGFACPDNLAFDRQGNLWMVTDMSYRDVAGKLAAFKNNSLFYIPMSGANAGKAFRVASAPVGAEFTGPCFAPDGRTLFLSVQHPGEGSESLKKLTSHWPEGGKAVPKPAVIMITGPALDALVGA